MTKAFPVILFMIICDSINVSAQFEGVIGMKVTVHEADTTSVMTYALSVKNDLLTAQVSSNGDTQQGKFIFRGDKKLLWIVNDEEKSYTEISLKENGKAAKSKDDTKQSESESKIQKTGKTQTILGYPCEELLVSDEGRESHLWATSKLGNVYEGLAKSFGEIGGDQDNTGERGWEEELASMKLFPLKIETMKDGKLEQTQEVTKVEPKTVPMSAFEPPKGYTKQRIDFDMQKLMEKMQQEMKDTEEETQDTTNNNQ